MKLIKLTQNKVTIINDRDFQAVNKLKWHIHSLGYAVSKFWLNGKCKSIYMHRLIINPKKYEVVDHINGNKLDNRRINLRECSQVVNCHNRNKLNINNTSGYRGVHFDKSVKRWKSQITVNKKIIRIGSFNNIDDAIQARMDFNYV